MKKTKKALASLAIASLALTTVPFNVLAADVPLRLAGNTAEQTAVEISKQTGWSGAAILASSEKYGMSDALAAGPLAYSLKAPILLTGNDETLNPETKAELSRLNVSTVYVTSGTRVIQQSVLNEISAMGITVVPMGGYDRAETSVNMASKMTGVTKVAVANSVPDALSIGSIAAAANQPILLVDKDNVSSKVTEYVTSNNITSTDVIGGTGIISDATAAKFPSATRHAGMTAYDTNNKVIQDFAEDLNFENVYIANGETAIDALSGAPLAAQTNSPIILTNGRTSPDAAAFVKGKTGEDSIYTALGGTVAISESLRQQIESGTTVAEPGDLTVTSVAANTASSVRVIFNKAPGDIENITIEVLQGVSQITLSTEWNETNTEVIASRSSKFPEGTYTVNVKEGETVLKTEEISITAQKVAKIDIYSKTLGVVNRTVGASTEQYGYASYRVLDQYGDDITKSALANNVNFQTGVGGIDPKNGLLTVKPSKDLNLLTFSGGVVITANDTSSGVSATATLEVTSKVGTLSDFQLKDLRNENGKTQIVAGDTAEIFYLDFEAKDIGGELTTNYTLIKEGLILTGLNDDQLTTSSSYVEAKLVQDPADSNKAVIEVKATDDTIQVDMPLVITAMTWAGSNSQFNTTLKKQAEVDSITLYAPDESIASGESKSIPFVAYDQNGDPITKYADLATDNRITLNGAYWERQTDGTAKIKNDAKPVDANSVNSLSHTITATTKTGHYSMITINIQKPAKADTLLLDSSVMISNLQQGGAFQLVDMGWDKGGLRVRDQYDRIVDMTNTQSGKVNENGKYQIRVRSTDPSILVSNKLGVATTSNGVDYYYLDYADQLKVESAASSGSASVIFELVELAAARDDDVVVETKSQTFTSIKNDDIKDYTIDQLTGAIYMSNGMDAIAGVSNGFGSVTDQEDEFKARPKVYGKTSSGGRVVLAKTPILGASVSSSDFTVYDYANNALPGDRVDNFGDVNLAYDEIRVVANVPSDASKSTSESTLSVAVLGTDNQVYNVTTPISSSKTRPAAQSVAVEVATELPGVSRTDEVVTIGIGAKGLTYAADMLGTLSMFNPDGSEAKQVVYFAPLDQYGAKGWAMSGFTLTETGTATSATAARTPDATPNAANSVFTATGFNTKTGEIEFNGSPVGKYFVVNATTASGLVQTVRVHFVAAP